MRSISAFLEKSAKSNRLAHAYLFAGSEYIDKLAVVQKFLEILKCDQLDYSFIEPARTTELVRSGRPEIVEKKEIKKVSEIGLKKITDLQFRLSLSPFKSPYQVAVINQAERMTKEAANALLKTLEEPSSKAILILITSSLNSILPTIQSRCQIIKFPAPSVKIFKKPEFLGKYNLAAKELNKLAESDLTAKYKYAENLAKDAGSAREQLGFWLMAVRDAILAKINCQKFTISDPSTSCPSGRRALGVNYSLSKLNKIIKKIKETNYLLANSSINARLALEVLMLEF